MTEIGALAVGVLLALAAHEGGHMMAAWSCGYAVRLRWHKLGPATEIFIEGVPNAEALTPVRSAAIAVGGPIFSLAFGALCLRLGVLPTGALASLELGVLNLIIPSRHADGWKAVAALRARR